MASRTATREEMKLGPFIGGINTYSDASSIDDKEMVDCVNFDVDLDGSLKSRPPWRLLMSELVSDTDVSEQSPTSQLIIGTYVYAEVRFILFSDNVESGSAETYIYYVDGVNAGTTDFIATGNFVRSVRYADDVYLIPGKGFTGGYKYSLNDGVVTSIATMPGGSSAVVYKDRLWITGDRHPLGLHSRIYFSELGDFTNWPSSNFFDINPGDGDATYEVIVYQDNLVIFKDNATYVLAYDTQPAAAVLQVINTTIGVKGQRTVVQYENSVFLLSYNEVYEMSNYNFVKINEKIPFKKDDSLPTGDYVRTSQEIRLPIFMSLVGDRLVCRFYKNIYVYHLRVGAWTRWESDDPNIQYMGPIHELDNTNSEMNLGWKSYVSVSALNKNIDKAGAGSTGSWAYYKKIFIMDDRYEDTFIENGNIVNDTPVDINCRVETKAYDVGLSHRFKRLYHWGADLVTGRTVTGTVFPFSVSYRVTWEQLHQYHWSNLQTWSYPLFVIPATETSPIVESTLYRRFIRFPKSLRFRLLQFTIEMSTTGNSTDGPARLYSITATIGAKQLTTGAVN